MARTKEHTKLAVSPWIFEKQTTKRKIRTFIKQNLFKRNRLFLRKRARKGATSKKPVYRGLKLKLPKFGRTFEEDKFTLPEKRYDHVRTVQIIGRN